MGGASEVNDKKTEVSRDNDIPQFSFNQSSNFGEGVFFLHSIRPKNIC